MSPIVIVEVSSLMVGFAMEISLQFTRMHGTGTSCFFGGILVDPNFLGGLYTYRSISQFRQTPERPGQSANQRGVFSDIHLGKLSRHQTSLRD